MAVNTATITAKIGPGNTVTSLVRTNFTRAYFDLVQQTLALYYGETVEYYDIAAATTFTMTVSSGVYTIAVS